MAFFGLFGKKEKKEVLDQGLEKTKSSMLGKIALAVAGKSQVDEEVLDELEAALVSSDVGVQTTIDTIHANNHNDIRLMGFGNIKTLCSTAAFSQKRSHFLT